LARADFTGNMVAVAVGDSLTVVDNRRQSKVRPAEVNAQALGLRITADPIMWPCNDAYAVSIA
jgi:hypothetical protein